MPGNPTMCFALSIAPLTCVQYKPTVPACQSLKPENFFKPSVDLSKPRKSTLATPREVATARKNAAQSARAHLANATNNNGRADVPTAPRRVRQRPDFFANAKSDLHLPNGGRHVRRATGCNLRRSERAIAARSGQGRPDRGWLRHLATGGSDSPPEATENGGRKTPKTGLRENWLLRACPSPNAGRPSSTAVDQ